MGLDWKNIAAGDQGGNVTCFFVEAVARTLNRAIFFEDAGRERQFGTRRRVKLVKS